MPNAASIWAQKGPGGPSKFASMTKIGSNWRALEHRHRHEVQRGHFFLQPDVGLPAFFLVVLELLDEARKALGALRFHVQDNGQDRLPHFMLPDFDAIFPSNAGQSISLFARIAAGQKSLRACRAAVAGRQESLAARLRQLEPLRAVDLGEGLPAAAAGRPFQLEGIAGQSVDVEVAFQGESLDLLAAALPDFSQRLERAVGRAAQLLGELAPRGRLRALRRPRGSPLESTRRPDPWRARTAPPG